MNSKPRRSSLGALAALVGLGASDVQVLDRGVERFGARVRSPLTPRQQRRRAASKRARAARKLNRRLARERGL
jgi:hypothetical protein